MHNPKDTAFSLCEYSFGNAYFYVTSSGVLKLGMGFHLALGADWIMSKRLLASFRVGQRFMTIEESHKSSTSSTGWGTFFVNPAVNEDHVSVNWGGPYASLGLSLSFYKKVKTSRPQ